MNSSAESRDAVASGLDVLGDLREVTAIELDYSLMSVIQRELCDLYQGSQPRLYSILAPQPLSYGMARMFMTMMSDFKPLKMNVFETLPDLALYHKLPPEAVLELSSVDA